MMYLKMKELMDECENLMKECIVQVMDIDALLKLDENEMKQYKSIVDVYMKSRDVSLEMATKMDDIDEKLDKIIRMLEKK